MASSHCVQLVPSDCHHWRWKEIWSKCNEPFAQSSVTFYLWQKELALYVTAKISPQGHFSVCASMCVCLHTLTKEVWKHFFPTYKSLWCESLVLSSMLKSRPVGVKQSLQHYVYVNLILSCLSSSSSSAFSIARSCIIDKLADNIGQCILKGP